MHSVASAVEPPVPVDVGPVVPVLVTPVVTDVVVPPPAPVVDDPFVSESSPPQPTHAAAITAADASTRTR